MRMPGVAMPRLVGYYGVFQAGHVVFNVVYLSGLRPIQEFPWPPPFSALFSTNRSVSCRGYPCRTNSLPRCTAAATPGVRPHAT